MIVHITPAKIKGSKIANSPTMMLIIPLMVIVIAKSESAINLRIANKL